MTVNDASLGESGSKLSKVAATSLLMGVTRASSEAYRKTTFFRFNRIVFLFSTALCLVLPLLHLSLPQMSVMPMNTIEEVLAPSVVSNGELYEMREQNVLLMAISAVYLIGTIVVLVGLSLSFIRMRLHMDKIPTQIIDGIKIK